MALQDVALNYMANQFASNKALYASLHSADPTTSGNNEVSGSGRKSISWNSASSGDISISANLAFTGLSANQTVTHVGIWDASTSGNWQGGFALTGDSTANASGEYTVTALTINGSAS